MNIVQLKRTATLRECNKGKVQHETTHKKTPKKLLQCIAKKGEI